MKFASPHLPTATLSPASLFFSWLLISVLIIMASLQLITFEKFVPIMHNYQFLDSPVSGEILAAVIVVLEVMALPVLLRMKVSRLLRIVSAACLIVTGLIWVTLGLWVAFTNPPAIGAGLLGGVLAQIPPMIVLPFGIFLLVVSLVVIYYFRHDFKT